MSSKIRSTSQFIVCDPRSSRARSEQAAAPLPLSLEILNYLEELPTPNDELTDPPVRNEQTKGATVMSKKKILLVDDSSTILMMEKFILKNDPYELVTAANGEEAGQKASQHQPDLILLDVMMPKMGGFDACKLIRANPETESIPIIMVTTRGEAENVENGWASGCTDYVTKPINAVELLAKVRSMLSEA
jgi:CheY-like chemotaxis protein